MCGYKKRFLSNGIALFFMNVTTFLSSYAQNPLVQALNVPISDQYFIFLAFPLVLLAVCCYLYFVKMDKKRVGMVLLTVFLALVLSIALKGVYQEARPCSGSLVCDLNFGFPSSHAAATFALAFALIGSELFVVGLLFAIYASVMRVLTTFHSLPQIAGGMALAIVVYLVLKELMQGRLKGVKPAVGETSRKVMHFLFGAVFVSGFYFLDFEIAVLLSCFVLLLCVCVKHALDSKFIHSKPLNFLERKGNDFGKGAFAFGAASLFCVLFARPLNEGLAVVAIIAAGDAASTLVGRKYGKSKFSFNDKKSIQGTVAFVIAALVVSVLFLQLEKALIYVAILSVVETAPIPLDDNLSVGIAGVVLTLLA